MGRERDRDEAVGNDEATVRDGNLVIEEDMVRRDGLVEYEGTVMEGAAAGAERPTEAVKVSGTSTEPGVGAIGSAATVRSAEETTLGASTRATDPMSMSTDNTAHGLMGSDSVETGPISQVREGMRVFDVGGDELGKVDYVQMGDASAASAPGEEMADDGAVIDDGIGAFGVAGGTAGSGAAGAPGGTAAPGAVAGIGDALFGGRGEDLPETLRNDLMRVGYLKIDGKGWIDTDRFARADQIAEVSADSVRLSVAKEALPSE